MIEPESAVLLNTRGIPLLPEAPFASVAEHGGDYFLHSRCPLALGHAAASPWVGRGAGRLFGVFTPHAPFVSDAPPPPLLPASAIEPTSPQQQKTTPSEPSPAPSPAPSEAARTLKNAGKILRAPPVSPGVDLRTHAGQSSKAPLLGTTIQANCHRCSSTIFYKPECAQVTCCECSTVILSVECTACGSYFGARVGDAQSSCPHCKFSSATSNLAQRRIDSFMQKEGPRATLLHPHEIHVITQVILFILSLPILPKTQSPPSSSPSPFPVLRRQQFCPAAGNRGLPISQHPQPLYPPHPPHNRETLRFQAFRGWGQGGAACQRQMAQL